MRDLRYHAYVAMYSPAILLRRIYKQLIVLFVMFLWGAAVFNFYDNLGWIQAFLASVSTITTIGLYVPNHGNLAGINPDEAILLIIMILVSVGAGASILQSAVNSVVNGELAHGEASREYIKTLKGHAIVFGYSHLGRYVAEKLKQMKINYLVVTKNREVYQDLVNNETLAVYQRDSKAIEALRESNIRKAALVIVCSPTDSDNMLFILSARKLRHDIRIVAVANDIELFETAKNAGADEVIPAQIAVGHLLALSAVATNLAGLVFSKGVEGKGREEEAELDATAKKQRDGAYATINKKRHDEAEEEEGTTNGIIRIEIPPNSAIIGREIREVSSELSRANLIGVVRNGAIVHDALTRPNFKIERGDALLALGEIWSLREVEAKLQHS